MSDHLILPDGRAWKVSSTVFAGTLKAASLQLSVRAPRLSWWLAQRAEWPNGLMTFDLRQFQVAERELLLDAFGDATTSEASASSPIHQAGRNRLRELVFATRRGDDVTNVTSDFSEAVPFVESALKQLTPSIETLPVDKLEQCVRDLQRNGWAIVRIDGRSATDQTSFIDRVADVVQLDPPMVRRTSWHAFADSLWEGLWCLPEKRVALIWEDSGTMRRAAPTEFAVAIEVLEQVIQALANPDTTLGKVTQVRVVLSEGVAGDISAS